MTDDYKFHGYFMGYDEMTDLDPTDGDTAMVEGVHVFFIEHMTLKGVEYEGASWNDSSMVVMSHCKKYGGKVHAKTGLPWADWIDSLPDDYAPDST